MSTADNSHPNLHNVKKTVPTKTKGTTKTTTTTTTKTIAITCKCPKWLMIPNDKLADYDVRPVHKCKDCDDADRTSYKHPFFVHNGEFPDYICFQCGEDGDIAYVCLTCRAQRRSHNRFK